MDLYINRVKQFALKFKHPMPKKPDITEPSGFKFDSTDGDKESANFECNICLESAKEAVISMCGHLFCWPCLYLWFQHQPYRTECPVCKAPISKDKVIPLYGRGSNTPNDGANEKNSTNDPRTKKYPPRPNARPQPPRYNQGANPSPTTGPNFNSFLDFLFPSSAGYNNNSNSYYNNNYGPLGSVTNVLGGHLSFGIGAFPFGLFTSLFSVIVPSSTSPSPGVDDQSTAPTPSSSTRSRLNHRDIVTDQFISNFFIWVAIFFVVWLLLA